MPRPITDRIAAIKAKQEQLAARLNTLSAKARQEERKRDTRRKIIVGGMVIAAMEFNEAFAERIRDMLARQVTRPNDREVIADLLPGAGAGSAAPALSAVSSPPAAPAAGE